MKRLDRPVFPVAVGDPVGWRGHKATVIHISPTARAVRLLYKPEGAVRQRQTSWIGIAELHDAPDLPDHVEAAADEAVASGLLTDGRRAVFGEGS